MIDSLDEIIQYFPERHVLRVEDAVSVSDIGVSDSFVCLQYLSNFRCMYLVIRTSVTDFKSCARFLRLAKLARVQVNIFFTDIGDDFNADAEFRREYEKAIALGVIFLNLKR